MIARIGPVPSVAATGAVPDAQVYRTDQHPGGGDRRHRGDGGPPRPARHRRARSVAAGTWLNAATARYPAVVLGSAAAERLGVPRPGRTRCGSAASGSPSSASSNRCRSRRSSTRPRWSAGRRGGVLSGLRRAPDHRSTPGRTSRRSRPCGTCSRRRPTRRRRTRSRCPGRRTRWPPGGPTDDAFTGLLLGLGAVALLVGGVGRGQHDGHLGAGAARRDRAAALARRDPGADPGAVPRRVAAALRRSAGSAACCSASR